MKNLLLLTLLICGNVFSQSNYTLPNEPYIYDLPGGDFLTAIVINDKTHIKHYNVTGNIVWEDSVIFLPPVPTVYLNKIARFKNTNEYIICSFADPTPFYIDPNINDTLVYQFTKLDLNSHLFTANFIDTLICKGLTMVEMKDTSIYILVHDASIAWNPMNQATYSLNSSMNLSVIAPLDSVTMECCWRSFDVFGDTIYKSFYGISDYHSIEKFSFQMATLEFNSCYLSTSMDNNNCQYKKNTNSDSLFIFTEGFSGGSLYTKWRFDWLNLSLESINSNITASPVGASTMMPVYYRTDSYKTAMDRTNRQIMILAKDISFIPTTVIQTIFVYDYNFNLVCEIPITMGNFDDNTLIELNDLVYLKNFNSANTELTKITCSMLNLNEFATNKEFEIYPNPTNSILNISNPQEKTLTISLISADGKEINTFSSQSVIVAMKLDSINDGLYFVKVNDGINTCFKRLIKE